MSSVRSFVVTFFSVVLAAGTVSAQTLPTGWSTKDVGAVAAAGSATSVNNIFTVAGSGSDVWGTADEFRFVYQQLTGDSSIVTQVSSVDYVDAWVKAGVMMRETLNANSKHAFMIVSPGKGLAFQRRAATGGESTHTAGGSGSSPYYVKLKRAGSTFTAYKSLDGVSWTTVGSQTITMASTIYVGLAVTSHVDGSLADATFSKTVMTGGASIAPAPTPPTTSSSTLRLLQWNVRHGGTRTDGVYDPNGLTDWILRFNPHVISLNEIDNSSQATTIIDLLTRKSGKTWRYNYDDRGNLVASPLTVTAESTCTVNAGVGRKSAHLSVVVNARTLNVWSSHLALDSTSVRSAEIRALQACGQQWSEARIFAGDYNMLPSWPEYAVALEGHIDAWSAATSLGTAVNYSGNCEGCTRGGRIDYVFASKGATNLVLKSAQIFDTRNSAGVMASDHKPLLVVYEVR